jgi:hypothetical protein
VHGRGAQRQPPLARTNGSAVRASGGGRSHDQYQARDADAAQKYSSIAVPCLHLLILFVCSCVPEFEVATMIDPAEHPEHPGGELAPKIFIVH